MTDVCEWCDGEIEEVDARVTVIQGEPHRDATVLAVFHDGVCYSEASDYGW